MVPASSFRSAAQKIKKICSSIAELTFSISGGIVLADGAVGPDGCHLSMRLNGGNLLPGGPVCCTHKLRELCNCPSLLMFRNITTELRNDLGVETFDLSVGMGIVVYSCLRYHLGRYSEASDLGVDQNCFDCDYCCFCCLVVFRELHKFILHYYGELVTGLLFGRGPSMSTATNFSGSVGGNRRSLCGLFVVPRLLADEKQSCTVAYISLSM